MAAKRILLRDRCFVPVEHVNDSQVERLEKVFKRNMYTEMVCKKCEYYVDRPSGPCDDCPSNLGVLSLMPIKRLSSVEYFGLPIGGIKTVKKIIDFDEFKVIEKRSAPKMKYQIEFTGELRDYQEEAVTKIIELGANGILESPPRSGKTVIVSAVIVRLGLKTMFLTSQIDWLNQFKDTLYGTPTQPGVTNIPDIEKFEQTKIVGFCKTLEDFEKYDICLVTYQTFLSVKGKAKFKKIADKFGLICIDESHTVGATQFSKTVNSFKSKHRIGLTATVDRKDGMHWMVKNVIGPILHTVTIETLVPDVKVVFSKECDGKMPSMWATIINRISKNEKRDAVIVKHAVSAVKDGHSVVIPVLRVAHAKKLTEDINRLYGRNIAKSFTGASDRESIIDGARKGKIKVVVGISKIVSTGINVPLWSCIIECMYSSNIPAMRQRLSRILTPIEGKIRPRIIYVLDDNKIARSCFANEFYQGCMIYIKPIIDRETRAKIKAYMAGSMRKKEPMGAFL